jgi:hypothetical protein
MKKLILLLIATIMAINYVFAQQKRDHKESNIQIFIDQSNKIIKDSFTDFGAVKGIKFQILKSVNLTDNKILNGIKLIYYTPITNKKEISYIDADEINDVIKILGEWKAIVFSLPHHDASAINVEYRYSCRSGFKIGGCLTLISGIGKLVFFVQLGANEEERIILTTEEVDELIKLLSYAETKFEIK